MIKHQLICDGETLAKGVRLERPWHCSCGAKFHGYDSRVRKDFRTHKLEA